MKSRSVLPFFLFLAAVLSAQQSSPLIRRVPGPNPNRQPDAPAAAESRTAEDYGALAEPIVFDGTNNAVLKFEKAPAEILLRAYADVTGKTLLIAPNVPKADNISLRSQPGVMLAKEEYLRAIETVLSMHNIALEPAGEKFLRVLPGGDLRKMGVRTVLSEPEGGRHEENGRMVSQIIQLKNISIEEAKKAIEGFKRAEGQIQLFERTNSILVTDIVENVNRIMEILRYIDIPIENREETHVRPVKYAKAADIKKRLEEIIAEALKEQQQNKTVVESRQSGAPGMVRRTIPAPGIIRPGMNVQPLAAAPVSNEIIETLVSDAERGVIRGKVQIVADERTNILIFITRPENMKFFDKIIDVLDVEIQTTPDVIVNVFRLEHATAKDVATMLNDLIGNKERKTSDQDNPNINAQHNADRGTGSTTLANAAARNRANQTPPPPSSESGKGKIGELRKENVTILSDERSNAVIVMASPEDMLSIEAIIKQMDIQLSQVVIETVIVSVTFKDTQETGMDWVQRAMLGFSGSGNGKAPVLSFATAGGGGETEPVIAATMTDGFPKTGGAQGWLTFHNINLDLILKAVQTDSRARVMTSPRITTMDNKEAKLEATHRIYWKEGTTYYSSNDNYSDNIKNEDVGIKLGVTPRINKNGYITLTISQEIQTHDGYTRINDQQFPNLVSRTMSADVALQSGETAVLGGLAQNTLNKTTTKVPVLGSIPLLGWLFRYQKTENERTDIIVFLTPRVINTPAEMEDDARMIKASLDTEGVWDSSRSHSRLADPLPEEKIKKIRDNADKTVSPPRGELSGYLSSPGEDGGAVYRHFSEAVEAPPPSGEEVLSRISRISVGESSSAATNSPPEETQQEPASN